MGKSCRRLSGRRKWVDGEENTSASTVDDSICAHCITITPRYRRIFHRRPAGTAQGPARDHGCGAQHQARKVPDTKIQHWQHQILLAGIHNKIWGNYLQQLQQSGGSSCAHSKNVIWHELAGTRPTRNYQAVRRGKDPEAASPLMRRYRLTITRVPKRSAQ